MKLKMYKVRFFASAVLAGLRTIEELPKSYREAVREYIEEQARLFEEEVQRELERQGFDK